MLEPNELLSATRQGLVPPCSRQVLRACGVLTASANVAVQGQDADCLFILTERYKICVLKYNEQTGAPPPPPPVARSSDQISRRGCLAPSRAGARVSKLASAQRVVSFGVRLDCALGWMPSAGVRRTLLDLLTHTREALLWAQGIWIRCSTVRWTTRWGGPRTRASWVSSTRTAA